MRALLAILLLNACSASGAAFTSPSAVDIEATEVPAVRSLEQACTAVAFVACRDYDGCSSLWEQFGSAASCVAGMRARCVRDGSARGVIDAAPRLGRCVSEVSNLACASRVRALMACVSSPGAQLGRLRDGASCFTHAQCASGTCGGNDLPLEPRCGTCRPTPRAGDACTFDRCMVSTFREADTNLFCHEVSLTCVAGDREGTPCSVGAMHCAPPMACIDGRCAHAIEPSVFAELGQACRRRSGDPFDQRPLCRGGSFCDLSNVCVPTLQTGASCAHTGGESYACGWDAVCMWRDGAETCVALPDACG